MISTELRLPSPMVGRYWIQNPRVNRFIAIVDGLLRLALPLRRRDFPIERPRKILLADTAHMGDVLVSTALFPILRNRFPDAEIGFLAGSWSLPLLKGHPAIARVHVHDHWYHNRTAKTLPDKLLRHWRTRRRALAEIRARKYDVAIDLSWYLFNSIPLLWRSGIRTRIGYGSGGFGPLLTHAMDWKPRDWQAARYQAELLRLLPMDPPEAAALRYSLPLPDPPTASELPDGFRPGNYLVVHMGTGSMLKEWPALKWRQLAQRLVADGHRLYFTGIGRREEANAAAAMGDLPGCANGCNRLDWGAYLRVLRGALAVICTDSLAAHLAAAFGRPEVVIATGLNERSLWMPLSEVGSLVTHPVACSPCFRSKGCEGMECIREVPVDGVLEALHRVMPPPGGSGRSA